MAAEKLDFAATAYKQDAGTDGINDWMEIAGTPHMEVFRVTSNESGDWLYCNKISKVTGVFVQNHGATFGTGATDTPKITVTNAKAGGSAKIAIGHSTTQEVFSVLVIGEI